MTTNQHSRRQAASSRHSLHAHVVQTLGERIVRGEFEPGDVLPNEETLAARLDVSRTVLREAMKVLTAKGLVEARPKIGTRVRDVRYWSQLDADVLAWRCASIPTDDFVQKLMQMREIIEPAAAALAAEHASDEQLDAIEQGYRAMEAATDIEAWTAADMAFHEAVLQATHNELLVSLFAVVETALAMFFTLSARSASDFRYSLPQHRAVLDAIRKGRAEAARKAMGRLIADASENVHRQRKRPARRSRA